MHKHKILNQHQESYDCAQLWYTVPLLPPDNHHSSDVVYERKRGLSIRGHGGCIHTGCPFQSTHWTSFSVWETTAQTLVQWLDAVQNSKVIDQVGKFGDKHTQVNVVSNPTFLMSICFSATDIDCTTYCGCGDLKVDQIVITYWLLNGMLIKSWSLRLLTCLL